MLLKACSGVELVANGIAFLRFQHYAAGMGVSTEGFCPFEQLKR